MNDESPILVTRGLRKNFESEGAPVRALRGVDFTMKPGEFVAVMGPSGCGKSTLLNLVAGLDTATDGEITLAGESLVGKSEDQLAIMRRKHIGIVFQFFNLLESMSVLENVTLPAVIAGAPRKRAEIRARDLLDLLGLADKAKEAPGVLSGGQRQRLAIARALANEPTLLLADEPTGALDSEGGHEVLELFRRLHASGQTILLVTHDDEVAEAGDRIVRMRDGRVVSDDDAHGRRRRAQPSDVGSPEPRRGPMTVATTKIDSAEPAQPLEITSLRGEVTVRESARGARSESARSVLVASGVAIAGASLCLGHRDRSGTRGCVRARDRMECGRGVRRNAATAGAAELDHGRRRGGRRGRGARRGGCGEGPRHGRLELRRLRRGPRVLGRALARHRNAPRARPPAMGTLEHRLRRGITIAGYVGGVALGASLLLIAARCLDRGAGRRERCRRDHRTVRIRPALPRCGHRTGARPSPVGRVGRRGRRRDLPRRLGAPRVDLLAAPHRARSRPCRRCWCRSRSRSARPTNSPCGSTACWCTASRSPGSSGWWAGRTCSSCSASVTSPTGDEKTLLGLSMLAAAVAALLWVPARERLNDLATRRVLRRRTRTRRSAAHLRQSPDASAPARRAAPPTRGVAQCHNEPRGCRGVDA